MTASFSRICRTTFSTKRVPAVSAGLGTAPTEHLTGKKCTAPIQPSNSSELQINLNIETRYQLYEIHTAETDIKQNPPDVIVIGGAEYPVVIVEPRTFGAETRVRVVMKKLVR